MAAQIAGGASGEEQAGQRERVPVHHPLQPADACADGRRSDRDEEEKQAAHGHRDTP